MKWIVVLALLCCAVAANLTEEDQFAAWMTEHGKVYTAEEFVRRFENFKATLVRIDELNAENNGAEFGLNSFADMSDDEFRATHLMPPREYVKNDMTEGIFTPYPGAPATFDWRDNKIVTAVKDQGQCGSCWAFSATEAIESSWIKAGHTTNTINLAVQQIVDCDKSDGGCNGGWPETAMNYIHSAGGQEGLAHYPYTAKNGACAFNSAYVEAKVAGYKSYTSAKDETTLQNNLVNVGPLSICLDASKWSSYKSGTFSPSQCCPGTCQLDHCVQLVGYNTTASPGYWIVRNSWGANWGISGYIHLQMGSNTCALTQHVMWPTV